MTSRKRCPRKEKQSCLAKEGSGSVRSLSCSCRMSSCTNSKPTISRPSNSCAPRSTKTVKRRVSCCNSTSHSNNNNRRLNQNATSSPSSFRPTPRSDLANYNIPNQMDIVSNIEMINSVSLMIKDSFSLTK